MYKSFHIIHKFKGELDVNTNTSIAMNKNKHHSNSLVSLASQRTITKSIFLFWRNITWFGWVGSHEHRALTKHFEGFSLLRCCFFFVKLRHDILRAGGPQEHRASSHATTANFMTCWALRVAPSEICPLSSSSYLLSFSSWLTSRWDPQGRPSSYTFYFFVLLFQNFTNKLGYKKLFVYKQIATWVFFRLTKLYIANMCFFLRVTIQISKRRYLKHNKIHWSVCVC